MIGLAVRLVSNRFSALSSAQQEAVSRVRRRTGLAIQADWAGGVNVDTGALKASIRTEEHGADETVVLSDSDYAIYQEYGTGVMAANPAATRAAEKHRRPYADEAASEIRRAS